PQDIQQSLMRNSASPTSPLPSSPMRKTRRPYRQTMCSPTRHCGRASQSLRERMRRRQMFPNVASLQRLPSESGADKSTQPRARQKRSFQRQSKLSIRSEGCPDRNYFRNLDTADGLSKTFRDKREQYPRPQVDQV